MLKWEIQHVWTPRGGHILWRVERERERAREQFRKTTAMYSIIERARSGCGAVRHATRLANTHTQTHTYCICSISSSTMLRTTLYSVDIERSETNTWRTHTYANLLNASIMYCPFYFNPRPCILFFVGPLVIRMPRRRVYVYILGRNVHTPNMCTMLRRVSCCTLPW